MSIVKNLEKKAIEVEIDKKPIKVVPVEGSVDWVKGFSEPIKISITSPFTTTQPMFYHVGSQKKLIITLNPETLTLRLTGVQRLEFKGDSPVRDGNKIKIGLILDEYLERYKVGNILYLGILKQDGSFGRIDCKYGYEPTHDDAKKLGLD